MIDNAEKAFRRSRVYELTAFAFGEPSPEFLSFVKEGEFLKNIRESLRTHPSGVQVDIHPLELVTEEAKDIDMRELRTEYGKMTSPEMNFLYECNYHPSLNASEEMGDVAGFYRAFGMGFTGDRPDHISMELEFMRLLAMKEAKALMDGSPENAQICVSAQREFLRCHLGRWSTALSRMTGGIKFYGPFSFLMRNWIEVECGRLSVKTDEVFYNFRTHSGEDNHECFAKEAAHEGI
jgi:TorA maturation chaperone TorD